MQRSVHTEIASTKSRIALKYESFASSKDWDVIFKLSNEEQRIAFLYDP